VHVLDTHACDGTAFCTPREVGFWHINGHLIQAAAINGQGSGAINGVIQRFFTWDAHNLDVKGENTLLVANYTMGIRLVDTTNKSAPVETSFYFRTRARASPASSTATSRDEKRGAPTSEATGTSTRATSGLASSSWSRPRAERRGGGRRGRRPSPRGQMQRAAATHDRFRAA
jgi:hypothetical protein